MGVHVIVYCAALEGIWSVALGKWLLQIAVVADDLKAVGARRSLIRNTMRFIDAFPFIVHIFRRACCASEPEQAAMGRSPGKDDRDKRIMRKEPFVGGMMLRTWRALPLQVVQIEVA